jgi:hypothetical protein
MDEIDVLFARMRLSSFTDVVDPNITAHQAIQLPEMISPTDWFVGAVDTTTPFAAGTVVTPGVAAGMVDPLLSQYLAYYFYYAGDWPVAMSSGPDFSVDPDSDYLTYLYI